MDGDRWVKKILHHPETKKMYHKYKDLIAIYDKIKQPIKFKRNEITQTVNKRRE